MKILKRTLTLFALVAVLSTAAIAQETANVPVTANVQAVLTLTPTAVEFGTIQQAAADLAANGSDGTSTNVGSTASAGALQIQGAAGIAVTVSWTNAILSNGTTAEDATFTPSVWNGTSQLTTPAGSALTISGGDVTLDIGGSLAAPGGTGSYDTNTGTGSPIEFTVQYN